MFVSLPPGEYVLMTRCNINIERSQKSPPSTILHTLQSVSTPKSLYKRRSLKPESRDALRMVFRWLDVDMDDALSVKDLIEFCEVIYHRLNRIKRLISLIVCFLQRYEETVPVENELKKLFESFETDANGNMTFEGFIELFETLNPGNTEALDEEVVFKMVQELLMMPYTGTAYEGQMNPDKIKEWIICIRSSSSRIDVEALRFENEELYKQMIW
jgi:Ca2+-binding EF-hand superfamily protein